MDAYPEDHVKIYQYYFYMLYPDPEKNPFFHTPEEDKESVILQELKATFSVEDPLIIKGLEFCKKRYETPTSRAHRGISTMLDNLSRFMESASISTGKDGSLPALVAAAKDFQKIRESYKGVLKDLMDEQKTRVFGDRHKAYDQ
jgi:hypothetical protein